MWITRQPRPKIPMRKSDSKKSKLLKILEDYIIGHDKDITSILLHLWRDQMIVTGYKQIKDWVNHRDVTDEDLKDFKGDYQRLAENQLKPIWERTMRDAVSPENPQFDWAKKFTRETENTQETPLGGSDTGTDNIPAPKKPFFPTFNFEPQKDGVRNYIQQHTAELVTNATEEQKKAIRSVISYSTEKKFSTDEIARNIRKTIGLNSRQATANTKYYNRVKEQLTNDHPKMKPENIEKRARKQADIYAKEQLSYRAQMIARTEIGNAYNAGAMYGVKEAIDQGLIASATKIWITSRNEANMCPGCAALEGTEIPIDGYFDYEGEQILSPLAHPNGKCTMEFHVEEPDFDIAFSDEDDMIELEENNDDEGNVVLRAIEKGDVKDYINKQKQERHLRGKNYIPGRSFLYGGIEDAIAFYKKNRGTGEPIMDRNDNWTHKERVEDDHPIGMYLDPDTGEEYESNRAIIHYSKTGSHITVRR